MIVLLIIALDTKSKNTNHTTIKKIKLLRIQLKFTIKILILILYKL